MGILFLMGLLFGVVSFFVFIGKSNIPDVRVGCIVGKSNIPDVRVGCIVGLVFFLFGMAPGLAVSLDVGRRVAKTHSMKEPVMVLKTTALLPFSNSNGAYLVTGENQYGKKVVWYLWEPEGELIEMSHSSMMNMIIFSNTDVPAYQAIRVNAGSFWRWFALIPVEYRFVIPVSGLQKGKIVKTYNFFPSGSE